MSLDVKDVLGMRLEDALVRLRAAGMEPEVTESVAPRRTRGEGTLRVVRLRGQQLTVCAFMDGSPE